MADQTITLHLPDHVVERAQQAAQALQYSVEQVLADMLTAMLPDVAGVPADLQTDLVRMTWLDDQGLWSIAQAAMPHTDQQRLQQLVEVRGSGERTADEQAELDGLRRSYGRIRLRKARAYALLSLRGGTPLLANN